VVELAFRRDSSHLTAGQS
jgi:hypothetical protein